MSRKILKIKSQTKSHRIGMFIFIDLYHLNIGVTE